MPNPLPPSLFDIASGVAVVIALLVVVIVVLAVVGNSFGVRVALGVRRMFGHLTSGWSSRGKRR